VWKAGVTLEHSGVVVDLCQGGDGHDLRDGAEPEDALMLHLGHVVQALQGVPATHMHLFTLTALAELSSLSVIHSSEH